MTTPSQPDEPVRPADEPVRPPHPEEPVPPRGAGDPAGRTGQHAVRRVPPPPTGQVPVVPAPDRDDRTEPPTRSARHSDDADRLTDEHRHQTEHPPAPAAAAPVATRMTEDDAHPSDRPERDRDAAALAAQRERRREEELAEPPRRPGVGRHLLGSLVGLVLTPLALLLVGIGTARLADIAGTQQVAADALGVGLLVVGLLLLAVVVLLGVWSPAVPIVGGLVWGVGLGALALILPGPVQDAVEDFAGDRVVPALVDPLAERAMSGELLVSGTVLVAAGIAAARSRRKGRRWAEDVAAAEAARRELTARDQARMADHGRTV